MNTSPTTEELDLVRRLGLDSLEGAFAYQGQTLAKPGLGTRRRVHVQTGLADGTPVQWYLKCYGPEPWGRRLLRRLMLGSQQSPAGREKDNIDRLHKAGVRTMRVLAFGQQRDLAGWRRSYILVASVPGVSLERGFADFAQRVGIGSLAMAHLNSALARLAATLHQAGLFHRDFYAGHIFMDESSGSPELYVIDAGRVIHPAARNFRWRVKDLAQLKFSMPVDWVRTHWSGVLDEYLSQCFGGASGRRLPIWLRAIDRKVLSIQRRQQRRARRATP